MAVSNLYERNLALEEYLFRRFVRRMSELGHAPEPSGEKPSAEIIDFQKVKRDRDSGHYHGPKSKKPTR